MRFLAARSVAPKVWAVEMVIMDEQSYDSRSGKCGSTKSQPQD
jgi:hypothetical protein